MNQDLTGTSPSLSEEIVGFEWNNSFPEYGWVYILKGFLLISKGVLGFQHTLWSCFVFLNLIDEFLGWFKPT